jgi:hypothetical protein
LVLGSEPTGSALIEERTDIPPAHAEALLAVCAGRLTLERSALGIDDGGAEVLIERIIEPGPLNTVTVEFHNEEEAEAFTPPAWFGHEITTEPSFGRQVISFNQMPDVGEVPLSDGIVEAVLDVLRAERTTGLSLRLHTFEPSKPRSLMLYAVYPPPLGHRQHRRKHPRPVLSLRCPTSSITKGPMRRQRRCRSPLSTTRRDQPTLTRRLGRVKLDPASSRD